MIKLNKQQFIERVQMWMLIKILNKEAERKVK